MSLLSRVSLILHAKGTAALDDLEDPLEILRYGYQQQHELLQKVKLGLVEVATSKQQLEAHARNLRSRVPRMDDQAKRALAAGREDLARISLERKHTALDELEDLERQIAEVADDERKLAAAQTQLAARIERSKTHTDITAARYTAAQAQVRVNEALSGVGGQLADLSMALGRAEEKASRIIARASAIDSLVEAGTLDLPQAGDAVEAELRKVSLKKRIDDEIAALKAQPAGVPPVGAAR